MNNSNLIICNKNKNKNLLNFTFILTKQFPIFFKIKHDTHIFWKYKFLWNKTITKNKISILINKETTLIKNKFKVQFVFYISNYYSLLNYNFLSTYSLIKENINLISKIKYPLFRKKFNIVFFNLLHQFNFNFNFYNYFFIFNKFIIKNVTLFFFYNKFKFLKFFINKNLRTTKNLNLIKHNLSLL